MKYDSTCARYTTVVALTGPGANGGTRARIPLQNLDRAPGKGQGLHVIGLHVDMHAALLKITQQAGSSPAYWRKMTKRALRRVTKLEVHTRVLI